MKLKYDQTYQIRRNSIPVDKCGAILNCIRTTYEVVFNGKILVDTLTENQANAVSKNVNLLLENSKKKVKVSINNPRKLTTILEIVEDNNKFSVQIEDTILKKDLTKKQAENLVSNLWLIEKKQKLPLNNMWLNRLRAASEAEAVALELSPEVGAAALDLIIEIATNPNLTKQQLLQKMPDTSITKEQAQQLVQNVGNLIIQYAQYNENTVNS